MKISREICVGIIETLKQAPSDCLAYLRLKGCIVRRLCKNKIMGRSSLEKGVRIARATPYFKTTDLIDDYCL